MENVMSESKYQFREYQCNCDITGDYNFKQLLGRDAPKDLICSLPCKYIQVVMYRGKNK
jgi:hypothetical protein